MNYKSQYKKLIKRAQSRILEGYSEKHHIIPKCMGGSDKKTNLVSLTAREHFIAHVLLVKMFPEQKGLINAVHMMCNFNKLQDRSKNRMYGWLRKRHSENAAEEMSKRQKGDKNSQYGTCWISHVEKQISKRIKKSMSDEYLKNGWVKGRNIKKIKCLNCIKDFLPQKYERFCSNCIVENNGHKPIRTNLKPKNSFNRKKVFTPYGTFDTMRDAAKAENVNVSTISRRVSSENNKEYDLVV